MAPHHHYLSPRQFLPDRYTFYGASVQNLPEIVQLLNRRHICSAAFCVDDLQAEWQSGRFNPAMDVRLVFDPREYLVGFLQVSLEGDRPFAVIPFIRESGEKTVTGNCSPVRTRQIAQFSPLGIGCIFKVMFEILDPPEAIPCVHVEKPGSDPAYRRYHQSISEGNHFFENAYTTYGVVERHIDENEIGRSCSQIG